MALRDLLKQTVTIEPFEGTNAYGEPQYGPPVAFPARVQQQNKVVRDTQGQEVVSSSQVYLDGSMAVTVKDRITLPDGTKPLILSLKVTVDGQGRDFLQVVYT